MQTNSSSSSEIHELAVTVSERTLTEILRIGAQPEALVLRDEEEVPCGTRIRIMSDRPFSVTLKDCGRIFVLRSSVA